MSCTDNVWGSCEVDPQTRGCTNTCGTGTETCENGVWGGKCVVPRVETPCATACGPGVVVCENDTTIACNAPQPLPPKLYATIRDFKSGHPPDFERNDLSGSILDLGIVAQDLGSDNLPVWAATSANPTVTTKANFDEWYREVPGVNLSTNIWLQLSVSPTVPGLFVYANTSFFPIDNQLFGNEGNAHNYHFTMQVSTAFNYMGGEEFYFEGDDDMWVFINRKLAIDLGGIHESLPASISLDQKASYLGIAKGGQYQLDFFFAERHTIASDFTIRTTIADIGSCP
jgi:fibro-slime domain-containing protein